jgi:hypothetical protein
MKLRFSATRVFGAAFLCVLPMLGGCVPWPVAVASWLLSDNGQPTRTQPGAIAKPQAPTPSALGSIPARQVPGARDS